MKSVVAFLVLCFSGMVFSKTIAIHYGYIDQRPYQNTVDAQLAFELVQRLTQACTAYEKNICGFKNLNSETTTNSAQKISLIKKEVVLQIYFSSVTNNDETNRNLVQQKTVSAWAESAFLNSLTHIENVIYVGHSRFGAGPDFFSPALTAAGQVDKNYYLKNNNGLQLASQALKQSQLPEQNLVLISCNAEKHFYNKLSLYFPHVNAYLAEGLQYPSQLNEAVLSRLKLLILK